MKHNKLHGVAHNYADSIAGGLSFIVPPQVIQLDVFAEAASNNNGYLVADFLTGRLQGAFPEGEVEHALPLFKSAFPKFCEKHNVDVLDYKAFLVRFIADTDGIRFVVTIEDRTGRRSSREYVGSQSKRSETLDKLGRRRPNILDTPLD
ncbi:hypothetical protein [Tritonibacter sp. SIMBA_163]|uniref:hypothetical protein n=1 Tax=Tritonibacter sp. SIMBA_163 TaxID=3080868 RepID=UPI00397ED709